MVDFEKGQALSNLYERRNHLLSLYSCHRFSYLDQLNCLIDIQVAAKETFQLTQDNVKEALYMSDVDPNEACVHALLNGEILVVLFKMLETDTRDFIRKKKICTEYCFICDPIF